MIKLDKKKNVSVFADPSNKQWYRVCGFLQNQINFSVNKSPFYNLSVKATCYDIQILEQKKKAEYVWVNQMACQDF